MLPLQRPFAFVCGGGVIMGVHSEQRWVVMGFAMHVSCVLGFTSGALLL